MGSEPLSFQTDLLINGIWRLVLIKNLKSNLVWVERPALPFPA